MHEEPNEQEQKYDAMERDVIYLLTDPDQHPPIWAVQDIGRQIDTSDPMSVIRPLCSAGLVHRTGDCIFATPAAYRMVGLIGHVA